MDMRNLFTSLWEIHYEAFCDFYPANSGVGPTFKQVSTTTPCSPIHYR